MTTRRNKKKKLQTKTKTIKITPSTSKKELVTFSSFEDEYEKSKYYTPRKAELSSEHDLVKMFKTPFSPSSVTARSNYYEYINYEWVKTIGKENKEKYFVELDQFRFAQDKVNYEVIDLVKKYLSKNKHTKMGKLVNNIYQSCLHLDVRKAKYHVDKTVSDIDDLIQKNNLWQFLAEVNKNEIVAWSCPIVWQMSQDLKNSALFCNQISSGQMSLYDNNLYFNYATDDSSTRKYKTLVMEKFKQFINKMFTACLGANHGLLADDVIQVETDILNIFLCKKVKHESPDYYNKVYSDKSLSKYGFDWETFSKQLGYDTVPPWFTTGSLNFLACASETLLANWKTPKWRTFWIYIHLKQLIRFHKEWRVIYFDFFEKFINGQDSIFPAEIYPIFGLSATFNTLLTKEYVHTNYNQTIVDYVNNIAYDLKKVFTRIITRNNWLSPSTKKNALKKFEYMKLIVGFPSDLRPDPLLDYTSDDPWGNMIKIANWRIKKFINLDGKPIIDIPMFDWNTFKMSGKQAYIVNCFYIAVENKIYIPLAYLQKPFIDMQERGIEYNLAHIGYALGHEMSHSLDTTGSQFDYRGNKISWWTPHDRKIFNRKVADVVKQYETFASYDKIVFDAEVGTGEDMADISGLAICLEYLRDFQDKNEDALPIRALSFHAFFVYIAIQGRQKVKKRAIAAQLKTNPHPMEQYRVNCALARLPLFNSLYNVQKGDKMYWPNKDTIW